MAATTLPQMAPNREEAARLLQDFIALVTHDHEHRFVDDIDHARKLTPALRASFLCGRILSNRVFAALYQIASRVGPILVDGVDLEAFPAYAELSKKDKGILRKRISQGYLAEIFKPGSEVSGAPPRRLLENILWHQGICLTEHEIGVQCGKIADDILGILETATKRYEEACKNFPAPFQHRRPMTFRRLVDDIPIQPPPFACGDAIQRKQTRVTDLDNGDQIVTPLVRPFARPEPRAETPKAATGTPEPSPTQTPRDKETRRAPTPANDATGVQPHFTPRPQPKPAETRPADAGGNAPTAPAAASMSISKLVETLCVRRQSGWNEKTKSQVRALGRMLADFAGADDVARLTQRVVAEFRDALDLLPKTHGKSPASRKLSIAVIIEKAADLPSEQRGLAPATIKRVLTHLRAILEAARGYGFAVADPASLGSMLAKDARRAEDKRGVFSADDLTALFQAAEFVDPQSAVSAAAYWLPLLGVYTGARTGELAGLRRPDRRAIDQDRRSPASGVENAGLSARRSRP